MSVYDIVITTGSLYLCNLETANPLLRRNFGALGPCHRVENQERQLLAKGAFSSILIFSYSHILIPCYKLDMLTVGRF